MNTIHLCNRATHLFPEGVRLLHTMQEDSDVEGADEAQELAAWIDTYAPGQFILVDTGDLIVAQCAQELTPGHFNCQTYDSTYTLLLVPIAIWEMHKDRVLAEDQAWRKKAMQCHQTPVKEVS